MKLPKIFRRKKALRLPKTGVAGLRETFFGASPVSVGRFTYGTGNLILKEWGEGTSLTIGSFCSLASDITILLGGNHRLDWATTYPFGLKYVNELLPRAQNTAAATKGDVSIGHDVWIGMNVTIMSGVTIGNGAVIAAGSVVSKDVGRYEVWGGNPARLLKLRFSEAIIEQLDDLRWWDRDLETVRKIAPLLLEAPTEARLAEIRRMLEKGSQ
ncbi:CatB-related O-acetyltransferase [uncultured Lentibacter sp.]|uniref:CatB-related O-acetyltransferase n=1 Tax=uncultured Lentibacter sp. TaxID=1659309 RepID=UPI00262FCEB5|nr:CatB-related O-acetyltransferase [uncultured Lentibacter sp.]